jgi:hypothetical protein
VSSPDLSDIYSNTTKLNSIIKINKSKDTYIDKRSGMCKNKRSYVLNNLREIKVYYCNAQSIRNKISDLHDILYLTDFNVVALSETWLIPQFTDGLLDPKGLYNIYRRDREKRMGGGVCILTSKSFATSCVSIDYDAFSLVELVGVEILVDKVCLVILCFYCAPNVSRQQFQKCLECLNSVLNCVSTKGLLLVGDFNIPDINWDFPNCSASSKESDFLLFSNDAGLQQINRFQTRGKNILDLILTNDPLIISNVSLNHPLGSSDHDSLIIKIILTCNVDSNKLDARSTNESGYIWSKANWDGCVVSCLKINWSVVFSDCHSSNDCWNVFLMEISRILMTYVPRKINKTATKLRCSKNKTYPKNVHRLICKKKKLWRKMKLYCNGEIKKKYKKCISLIKHAKIANELSYESKIIESQSIGAIYRHISSRLNHRSGIAPLRGLDGKMVVDDTSKAELLNAHFVTIGTVDNGDLPETVKFNKEIDDIVFTKIAIVKVIEKLKTNTAHGPDGLPPILYKSLKFQIAEPLSLLFKQIYQYGELPDKWKEATIRPIFKKGNSSDPNNYRPISLTCVCCKLFESVVKNHMLIYLLDNSIISKTQHGFLKSHSTTTNLIESLNNWTQMLENKKNVKVLYVDFEKAFDKVSIPKLLHKLNGYGIKGQIFLCIKSFLTSRFQSVRIGTAQSSPRQVISGVPQGSVLGPFLFLLYINDLPDAINDDVNVKLFADDLKAFDVCISPDDNDKMQSTLNSLIEWGNRWQLKLSTSKCGSLLIVGKSKTHYDWQLSLEDTNLNVFQTTKDLGVLVDSKLNFSQHIGSFISKANQRVYLMLKSFKNRNINLMIFAFKVYILPLLEYCSPVWSPYKLEDIDRIERVQRSYTKKLVGLRDLPYVKRLEACDLPSLELRRLRTDLILCFKIVHRLIAIDFSDFFELEENKHFTRGHKYKLRIPKICNTIRKNFFSIRIIPVWNHLPADLVSIDSVAKFKQNLMLVNLGRFLIRNIDYGLM